MNEIIEQNKVLIWSERSQDIDKLAVALSKAQAVIENAVKDSSNPFFNSKYADLASVWAVIRKPLTDNGLSIIQEPYSMGDRVGVKATLLHSSGQYTRSSLEVPLGAKKDAQGYGSAITYVRRYQLQAIAGVAPEDDDGNAASGSDQKPNKQSPAQPVAKNNNKPMGTPRPADDLPPKAISDTWDGTLKVHGGKYKDQAWKDLPPDYLEWARHNAKQKETQRMAELEISRREQAGMPDFEAINDEAFKDDGTSEEHNNLYK